MDTKKILLCDIECYKNYFLIMFKRLTTGEIIFFEKLNGSDIDVANIVHILSKYTIVTFNGNKYDSVIWEAACQGFTNESLKKITDELITGGPDNKGIQPWEARRQFGIAQMEVDHIDLIEVAPLKASLKIYGGRLHCPTLKNLPIEPSATIKESDVIPMRTYCADDLVDTEMLLQQLIPELDLRENMSKQYKTDLRSKSDAQVAEAVIKAELKHNYGLTPKRNKIKPGTSFNYNAPDSITFETDILNDILDQYTSLPFTIMKSGHVSFNFSIGEDDRIKSGKNKGELPDNKAKLKVDIHGKKYTLGIGGIHSNEKSSAHIPAFGEILKDIDVASYYPECILNQKLYPEGIGIPFLDVYGSIVKRRLKAKREGNTVVNESLKITINGSFGKFGSKWSILYAPNLMIQVTITGQLSLLMLIERMELAGVDVVSANTDGIVIQCEEELEPIVNDIISDWEFETEFKLEATNYKGIYSRDVNNYIAVKIPREGDSISTKGKGAYADQYEHYYKLRSNPLNEICKQAVKQFLMHNTPVEETIRSCEDIRKFLNLRTVNGGAVKDGVYLGRAIRWYYGSEDLDAIYYSTNGNKVPKSDGGVPLIVLPDRLPVDIDYRWYINTAKQMIKDIGID